MVPKKLRLPLRALQDTPAIRIHASTKKVARRKAVMEAKPSVDTNRWWRCYTRLAFCIPSKRRIIRTKTTGAAAIEIDIYGGVNDVVKKSI